MWIEITETFKSPEYGKCIAGQKIEVEKADGEAFIAAGKAKATTAPKGKTVEETNDER